MNFLEISENNCTFYGLLNLILEVLKSYIHVPITLIKNTLFYKSKGGQCGRTTKSYEERCRHLPGQAEQPRYPEGQ